MWRRFGIMFFNASLWDFPWKFKYLSFRAKKNVRTTGFGEGRKTEKQQQKLAKKPEITWSIVKFSRGLGGGGALTAISLSRVMSLLLSLESQRTCSLKFLQDFRTTSRLGSCFLIPSIVFNLPQVTLIYQTLCEQKHWGRQLSSLSFYSRACTEPLDVALKCRALGLQRHGHSLLPQLSACLGIAS